MNVFHPGCARPPRWSPPVLWRRFEDGLASISGRNIIKQHSETVIVWSTKILIAVYQKILLFYLLYFSAHFCSVWVPYPWRQSSPQPKPAEATPLFLPTQASGEICEGRHKTGRCASGKLLSSALEFTKNRLAAGLRQKPLAVLTVLPQAL